MIAVAGPPRPPLRRSASEATRSSCQACLEGLPGGFLLTGAHRHISLESASTSCRSRFLDWASRAAIDPMLGEQEVHGFLTKSLSRGIGIERELAELLPG